MSQRVLERWHYATPLLSDGKLLLTPSHQFVDLATGQPRCPAARKSGLGDVPLICAQELDIARSTPRCIRVMMHLNTDKTRAELHREHLRHGGPLITGSP